MTTQGNTHLLQLIFVVAAKRTCEDNEKPTTSNVDDTSKKIEGLLTQRTTPLFAPSTAEVSSKFTYAMVALLLPFYNWMHLRH